MAKAYLEKLKSKPKPKFPNLARQYNTPKFPKLTQTLTFDTTSPSLLDISDNSSSSEDDFIIYRKSNKRKKTHQLSDSEDELITDMEHQKHTTQSTTSSKSHSPKHSKKQKTTHTPIASKPCPQPSDLTIPQIFTSPQPKNTHKTISTKAFFEQYDLQGRIFDIEYKKFSKKHGYSRKKITQPTTTPFIESQQQSGRRAARQQQERQANQNPGVNTTGMRIPKRDFNIQNKRVTPISCLSDIINPHTYILQKRFKPQNIFGILHLLTHLQDLYLATLSAADYQLFLRIYIERNTSRTQFNFNTPLGAFRIDNSTTNVIYGQCQNLGNNHGLNHAKDFSLFFKMSNSLHIIFKTIALGLLNSCPQSVQHSIHLSTSWHDNFALAPSSQKQYKSTLKQFSIFLVQSDGPRALELTLDFLNTHEFANHLIANFLLLRTLQPYQLQFTTVRNKMIYLSYFQRYRKDQQRFTKVDYWIKFFFNRALGRLFTNTTTGAPPFTRNQLTKLFTAIENSDPTNFPTKHRDQHMFKYAASLAFRTQEMTDLLWWLTDFDENYLIQGIDNAKNDKIHSKGQFLYFQKTNTNNCPVFLINKLWEHRHKDSHFICTQHSGKPHTNASINKLLRRYLKLFLPDKQAKRFSFYSFRTSYVAIMSTAQEGDNLPQIQKILRQKVIESTAIYHNKRFSRPPTSKGNFLETVKSKLPQLEIIDPSIFDKFFTDIDQDALLHQYQAEHISPST